MDDWLAKTAELQASAYGKSPSDFAHPERVAYVKEMILALTDEAHEALAEISWKSWQKAEFFNRDAFISELVDAAHFLANCAIAAGCTDSEWQAVYEAKMQKNRERQQRAGGYRSEKGVDKCACGRAYDDSYVECTPEGCAYENL